MVSYGNITLAISNTTFSKNNAETGGAIYINCPNGTINIDFTDLMSISVGAPPESMAVQYRSDDRNATQD